METACKVCGGAHITGACTEKNVKNRSSFESPNGVQPMEIKQIGETWYANIPTSAIDSTEGGMPTSFTEKQFDSKENAINAMQKAKEALRIED